MNLIQTEAVVLQASPFKEYDRIVTLFSPQGLLKLFVKSKKKEYLHFAALTTPLTLAEFHYTSGRKDLHRLFEGSILKQHVRIRDRYETLSAAENMIQALLRSQWTGKPAPKLFQLFTLFIEHLPASQIPSCLSTAFLLKILKHEGVLHLCTPLEASCRFAGERYPQPEAPPGALLFTAEEEEWLAILALARSFSTLDSQPLSPEFQKKIETLFSQAFD